MNKQLLCSFALLLSAACATFAQRTGAKLVKVTETDMRDHTVHVLVCSIPAPKDSDPPLRILLACTQNSAPSCVQPFASALGIMEDLDADFLYEGHNVRVEWLDGGDGSHNVVGVYQVQSSSVEKCEVR